MRMSMVYGIFIFDDDIKNTETMKRSSDSFIKHFMNVRAKSAEQGCEDQIQSIRKKC